MLNCGFIDPWAEKLSWLESSSFRPLLGGLGILTNKVHVVQKPNWFEISRLFISSPRSVNAKWLCIMRKSSASSQVQVEYKLLNKSFYYDIRKYSFRARTINTRNSLANNIVDAESVKRDRVLEDCPRPRGHLEDKFRWPWPRIGVAFLPWPWPRKSLALASTVLSSNTSLLFRTFIYGLLL